MWPLPEREQDLLICLRGSQEEVSVSCSSEGILLIDRRRKHFDDAYVKELEEQVKTLTRLVDANNIRAMNTDDASGSHTDPIPEYPAQHSG